MSIQPLPADVVAQIKSSTQITSLNSVVFELLKNSLDAGSTKVDISLEYAKGNCAIEDNGCGILPSEFREGGGLGKLYHSSKLKSETPVHGLRGSFLSLLAAIALLSITSHHHGHHSHNSIKMHKSGVVARQTPAPPHQALTFLDHGTRVAVRDLFGNMPVRVKQRAVAGEARTWNNKEWKELKHNVVLILLCWPTYVMVTIKEVGTVQRMVIRSSSSTQSLRKELSPKVDISKICSILLQASYLTSEQTSSWVGISAYGTNLRVDGAISLDAAPTKHLQFFSYGIQPVLATDGKTILHDEVNRLFSNSSFGNEEDVVGLDKAEQVRRANDARYKSDGFTNRELKGGRKSVDRWPMFYINIRPTNGVDMQREGDVDDILDNRTNKLGLVLELIQAMILEFLNRHHFRPKKPRRVRLQQKGVVGRQNQENPLSTCPDIGKYILRSNSAPISGLSKPSSVLAKPPRPHKDGLLGVDVTLPSFRRSSLHLDLPFSAWSRVKESGQARHRLLKSRPVVDDRVDAAACCIREPTSRSKSQIVGPLLSSTGRIIRRPFEDVELRPERPVKFDKHHDLAVPSSGIGDAVVEWVNPTTKVKSLVNRRTGHAEAAKKTESRQPGHFSSPSRRTRLMASGEHSRRPTPWINDLIQSWDNPIYIPAEASIPQLSIDDFDDVTKDILHHHNHTCSQIDVDHAFKDPSRLGAKISKKSLKSARVICQVDRKFILVKLRVECTSKILPSDSDQDDDTLNTMLVIIDQHAADERIRIEALIMELCSGAKDSNDGQSKPLTDTLDKTIVFETSNAEIELLRIHRLHFQNWGIMYELPNDRIIDKKAPDGLSDNLVEVKCIPLGISERCKADPGLLIELVRTEAWKCAENPPNFKLSGGHERDDKSAWLRRIHSCPQGILDMLNSRACRSAIMFNDILNQEQCTALVKKLADCMFPFQCAHGRLSLFPLVDFETLEPENGRDGIQKPHPSKPFSLAFRSWKKGMNNHESRVLR
ncbi:hypothetical protein BJ875DRAFT_165155 [Amylocarpus encephaloides]|uniref:MutL C-terminal dimerisation domain-containing protein n=1 Tax=Amylocarpus encephaloides TaxID=45428 RepID=A0A9P7YPA0_9HELO|nr:hypothetical protein BJ875DRAFT_165155 [Amylocarpus encephaloides]